MDQPSFCINLSTQWMITEEAEVKNFLFNKLIQTLAKKLRIVHNKLFFLCRIIELMLLFVM